MRMDIIPLSKVNLETIENLDGFNYIKEEGSANTSQGTIPDDAASRPPRMSNASQFDINSI
jgi:hypothetical protein